MTLNPSILIALIIGTAILSRLPFLRFPIDDDFAIYTYVARFADRGLQWKKDLFLIGHPLWRMRLMDKIYGTPATGIMRTRLFFMFAHVLASIAVFLAALSLTGNLWAAFPCGLLYSFYGSSPDFTAGNYSLEQFYIPFIFIGLSLLPKGAETIAYAGLAFGLASVAKWSSGSYAGILAGAVAWRYGYMPALVFASCAALPVTLAILTDWMMGYMDIEGKKQGLTRLATTLRLTHTKRMYFSILREVLRIMGQTLPVWVIGLPVILGAFSEEHRVWMLPFTGVTIIMIFLQRGFSRYHYHPLIALLSLATGLGLDHLLHEGGTFEMIGLGALLIALTGNLGYMLPFYIRPMDIKILSRHEKFDQYIYLPHLGKVLKRLMRMRGETGQRIFVWGTFSQLYHLTDTPAADKFLHHTVGPWDTQDLEPYFDTVIGGLIQHRPVYLIKTFHDLDIAQLEQVTGLKYRLLKVALVRYPVYLLDSYQRPAVDPLTLPWQEKMRIMQILTENLKTLDPKYLKKTDCEWKHIPGINKTDIKAGRLMTALKECKRLCKLNAYDTQGLYLLGKLYDRADRPDLSSNTFHQLLKLAPNHPHVRLIMAKQKINQGKLEEAESLIKADIRLFGRRDETDFYHGKICQQRKQYSNAAMYFESITKTMPEWVDVQIQLGDCLIEMGRLEDAARVCDQAFNSVDNNNVDRDWLHAQAASGAAKALAQRQPISTTLEQYLLRDPQNIIIAHRRTHFLLDEGNADEAKTLFETFSERFKDYPENNAGKSFIESQLFHLGQIHKRAGQFARAVACLKRVIHTLPRWLEAQQDLAESLVALGKNQKAVYHYELSFELAGQHADKDWIRSQIALALAKLCSNEFPSSETLKIYSNLDPHNEILAYASASALESEGHTSEARLLFKKFTLSFKKDHLRANAWFRLARLSPTEQQKPLLVECIKLNPDHGGAQKLLRELDCKEQFV